MEKVSEFLSRNGFSAHTTEPLSLKEDLEHKAAHYNEREGNLHETDGYKCSVCKNKADIMVVAEVNGRWECVHRDCKCAKARQSIRLLEKSGLKGVMEDYPFSKFTTNEPWQAELKRKAQEYAKSPSGWFFVGGQSGSGKTHICTAICREFLLSNKAVRYLMWRDDVVKLKAAVNDEERYDELMRRYKRADVLYIDDLFKTGKNQYGEKQWPTGADVNIAFELLNYRYINKLPTIISSECSIDDLEDIDEAVASRIYERSMPYVSNIKKDKSRNYRTRGVTYL